MIDLSTITHRIYTFVKHFDNFDKLNQTISCMGTNKLSIEEILLLEKISEISYITTDTLSTYNNEPYLATSSRYNSISEITKYIKDNTTNGNLYCLMYVEKVEISNVHKTSILYILRGCFIKDQTKYDKYLSDKRNNTINNILD
jgi:hypothetical protein